METVEIVVYLMVAVIIGVFILAATSAALSVPELWVGEVSQTSAPMA